MGKKIKLEKVPKKFFSEASVGMKKEVEDEMAIPSYLHHNKLINWIFWRRFEIIIRFCNLKNTDSVLDFGCGTGALLPTLSKNAKKVYATDLVIDVANKLVYEHGLENVFFVENNLNQIPNEKIDIIIAADVLEHIENIDEYLSAFRKKLKPEGRLIVSGPTENFLYKIGRLIAGFKNTYHHSNVITIRNKILRSNFYLLKTRRLPSNFLPSLFHVICFRKI